MLHTGLVIKKNLLIYLISDLMLRKMDGGIMEFFGGKLTP